MTNAAFWTFIVIVAVGIVLGAAYLALWVRDLRRSRIVDNTRLLMQRELDAIRDDRTVDRRGVQYPRSWQPFLTQPVFLKIDEHDRDDWPVQVHAR